MPTIWNHAQLICPLCRQALAPTKPNEGGSLPKSMSCPNKHSFDIGKPGYLHLIPVQLNRSKEPGDNKEMVAARKRFLSKGYYQPISYALNQLVTGFMAKTPDANNNVNPWRIMDLGCGEGYYTTQLSKHINISQAQVDPHLYGIDISKAAIQQAARRTTEVIWIVANSKQIPLPNQSVDIVLSVFSPIIPSECHRILKPNGLLVTVTAESMHLLSLRNKIYDKVRQYDNGKLEKQLSSHFKQHTSQLIRRQLGVSEPEDLLDLLHMTPHYWRASADKRKQLAQLSSLETELAIQLQAFIPT